MNLAPVSEEQKIAMGICNENLLNKVLFFGLCSDNPLSAPVLLLVNLDRSSFYVPCMAYCDNHVLLLYQVLYLKLIPITFNYVSSPAV